MADIPSFAALDERLSAKWNSALARTTACEERHFGDFVQFFLDGRMFRSKYFNAAEDLMDFTRQNSDLASMEKLRGEMKGLVGSLQFCNDNILKAGNLTWKLAEAKAEVQSLLLKKEWLLEESKEFRVSLDAAPPKKMSKKQQGDFKLFQNMKTQLLDVIDRHETPLNLKLLDNESDDSMTVEFACMQKDRPGLKCSFRLSKTGTGYQVTRMLPFDVPDMDKLVGKLDETDDLFRFILCTRILFSELLASRLSLEK